MQCATSVTLTALLIEADGDILHLRKQLDGLAGGRNELIHASSLKDGLSALARRHFDAVLVDLGLPDGNGLDGVSSLKQHAGEVPVLVLTGGDDDAIGLAALRLGVQDCPHLEALELRDFNARDVTPTQDRDAFPPDAVTEAEIDAMYMAEMERRDREAARPLGYRDAACEACGCALFVPVGQSGDALCPQCQREGAALAAAEETAVTGDDDDPRPPASGAMHPAYAEFAGSAARMLDDELCAAIGVVDSEPARLRLDAGQQAAFVAALSAEVVRRVDRRPAA